VIRLPADHPLLRLFLMPYRISFTPQDDCTGKWTLCTPETAVSIGLNSPRTSTGASGFSPC